MTSSAARGAYLPPQCGQLMPKCGIISRLFDLNRNQIEVSCDLIDVDCIAGLMGAFGVILTAAAAHTMPGTGLDSAAYIEPRVLH
jgi:hypothetical protein